MKAVMTVGLGFGDEGKGATVDFLVRELSADLVVRYSGGAQAGHNVELPDGRRHTFSQFGAGTLAGARTWLGPRMILSPTSLVPEAEHLQSLGVRDPLSLVSVHPDCLVTTFYHATMNRLREAARGDGRHGSCGMGIGEARHYWLRQGLDAVVARDVLDRQTLVAKLTLLRDRLLLEMQELPTVDRDLAARLHATRPASEADILIEAAQGLAVNSHPGPFRTVVFEGAQGVLLDEWYGFHPFTTWSTVTAEHALELAAEWAIRDVTVLGVTRAYTTRHGAGPFPTWSREMSAAIEDRGNPPNDWQGTIRSGPLDLVLLDYALRAAPVDGLVVTGLDQLPAHPQVCPAYANLERLELPQTLREQAQLTSRVKAAQPVLAETTAEGILEAIQDFAPLIATSHGPSHESRTLLPGAILKGNSPSIRRVAV